MTSGKWWSRYWMGTTVEYTLELFMPGLHSHQDSKGRDKNESVKGTFILSVMFSTCSCLILKLSYFGKSVLSQRKRECLKCLALLLKVLWLYSCSVLKYRLYSRFKNSNALFQFNIHLDTFSFSSPLSRDFRELYLSRSSRTRVWMSTFMRTSSRSQFLKSFDEYLQWECKPGSRH